MRQEPGLFQYQLAHRGEIFECALEAQVIQKTFRLGENFLGLVSQAEQRLFASGAAARFGDRQDFVRREVRGNAGPGVGAERAIAAVVAAKMRQGNEDLPGIADGAAFPAVAQRRRSLEQRLERGLLHQRKRIFARYAASLESSLERGTQAGWDRKFRHGEACLLILP